MLKFLRAFDGETMRKLYVLSVVLLAIALSGIQPRSASAGQEGRLY
jgi:hypothetical protein